ncbi:MAG: dihydropteroate synthase, partial [Oscillospiraceae bacterium]|nr:dihydropteroate synthase [Oscillospiraceae bacterium]
ALVAELDPIIAVDTWKSSVAEAALAAGATMINDIYGFVRDPHLAAVCAKHDAVCCLMHNRDNAVYADLLGEIKGDILRGVEILRTAGVAADKIIIDPGIGFAKSAEENVEVLRNLGQFCELGYPVMLGTSRKSFMGKTIGLALEERRDATVATSVLGIAAGCDFLRVHDIAENKQAAMMTDYITRETWTR